MLCLEDGQTARDIARQHDVRLPEQPRVPLPRHVPEARRASPSGRTLIPEPDAGRDRRRDRGGQRPHRHARRGRESRAQATPTPAPTSSCSACSRRRCRSRSRSRPSRRSASTSSRSSTRTRCTAPLECVHDGADVQPGQFAGRRCATRARCRVPRRRGRFATRDGRSTAPRIISRTRSARVVSRRRPRRHLRTQPCRIRRGVARLLEDAAPTPININWRYVAAELRYVIDDAELRAMIVETSTCRCSTNSSAFDASLSGDRRRVGQDRPIRPSVTPMSSHRRRRPSSTSSAPPTTCTCSTPAARQACRRA